MLGKRGGGSTGDVAAVAGLGIKTSGGVNGGTLTTPLCCGREMFVGGRRLAGRGTSMFERCTSREGNKRSGFVVADPNRCSLTDLSDRFPVTGKNLC